jgi:nucleoid-associated protein YgaU
MPSPNRLLAVLTAAAMLGACAPPKRLDRPRAAYPVAQPLPAPTPVAVAPAAQAAPVARPATPAATARTIQAIRPTLSLKTLPPAVQAATPPSSPGTADEARYLELARQEMQQLAQFTGLTDTQLARVRTAEAQIDAGQGSAAYAALQRLSSELRNASKPYTVKSGDSLWIISGKPDIYGNPWLWPLIWQANLRVVPDPDRLNQGQVLKIRPNPTIGEVVDAVNTAHERVERKDTTVGEIREVAP